MESLKQFLYTLLVKVPIALGIALLNLLLLLLLLIPFLLVLLWEWLVKFLRSKNWRAEEEEEDDCCKPPFPEEVMRRPDPCIYSQKYLAAQGLPVTWDNPDIWMAKAATPNVIEPDSYHLEADTDYIVFVQVHNASTDVALGVRARLLFRPWSFNSPDLVPVEVDGNGQEVVRFVNVAGMGAAITQFAWHTPPVAPGQTQHFCLQAHVSHPLDVNLENNMGQENTDVHGLNPGHVQPGEVVDVAIPLFNHGRDEARFAFAADTYAIATNRDFVLRLQTNTGTESWPLSRRLGAVGLSLTSPRRSDQPRDKERERPRPTPSRSDGWRLTAGRTQPRHTTRARYVGHEALRAELLAGDYSLPEGMEFRVVGGEGGVVVGRGVTEDVPVQVEVPANAQPGEKYAINVTARRPDGAVVGGVTIFLEVET